MNYDEIRSMQIEVDAKKSQIHELELEYIGLHQELDTIKSVLHEKSSILYGFESELSSANNINDDIRNEHSRLLSGVEEARIFLNNKINKVSSSIKNILHYNYDSYNKVNLAKGISAMAIDGIHRNKEETKELLKVDLLREEHFSIIHDSMVIRSVINSIIDEPSILQNITYEDILHNLSRPSDYGSNCWHINILKSIVDWSSDHKSEAMRAMELALQKDSQNSAIIYFLLNLRLNRTDVSLKWLEYEKSEGCRTLSRKGLLCFFSLLGTGWFSEEGEKKLWSYLSYMIKNNSKNDETALVDKIKTYLRDNIFPEDLSYPNLKLYSDNKQYSKLALAMSMVKSNQNILDLIQKIKKYSTEEENYYFKEYLAEIVNIKTSVELDSLKRIRAQKEGITIDNFFEDEQYENQNNSILEFDSLAFIFDCVFSRSKEIISDRIKRNMLVFLKDYLLTSYEAYVSEYCILSKSELSFQVGGSNITDVSNQAEEGSLLLSSELNQNIAGDIRNQFSSEIAHYKKQIEEYHIYSDEIIKEIKDLSFI